MKLSVRLSRQSVKFLKGTLPKHRAQIKQKIRELMLNPYPHDARGLIGFAPFLRTDIGEYRIVYYVEEETLLVVLIGKRNDGDVYRKMKRKKR